MSGDETVIASIKSLKQDESKKPFFTFIKGSRLGQIYPLDKPEITVGRSPDCELWIEDGAISRKHFKVTIKNSRVFLSDLASTNGTYVNGEAVRDVSLNDGDKIQISQETLLELTYLDETRVLSDRQRYEMGVKDPVTNLYNKRYFLARIQEEFSFSNRKKRPLSVIMFDIDHFKKLNDGYGHLAGDVALQKLSAELSRAIRSDDILARYGGEEFVVVMRDADLKSAMILADRLRGSAEKLNIAYEGKNIHVTISCGVATLSPTHKNYEMLMSEADGYLYQSKNNGRNRVTGPLSSPSSSKVS